MLTVGSQVCKQLLACGVRHGHAFILSFIVSKILQACSPGMRSVMPRGHVGFPLPNQMFAAGIFFNLYTVFYMISPRHCHAFVGYLEEEAVKTYTHCLHDIDSGKLEVWKHKKAPDIAIEYWNLDKNATMRDVILAVRSQPSQ